MTHFDKWQKMMEGFISPQVYVDFGFYFIISSALQRRVWFGPDHSPLFPNNYFTLVGDAGLGKGLVLKQVESILKEHKLNRKVRLIEPEGKSDNEKLHKQILEASMEINYEKAKDEKGTKPSIIDEPLLIPLAPQATTYEALVTAMAEAVRIKVFKYKNDKGEEATGTYMHSSLCCLLEEMSSLIKKHGEAVLDFLLVGYDCGDYKKKTKHHGIDIVQKMCINFLAGSTPSYIQRTFTEGILTEGWSGRNLFVYANRNRHNNLAIPDLTDEQKQCRKDIVAHTLELTKLYGRVYTDQATEDFLQDWWNTQCIKKESINEKMRFYWARKNIHMRKLAMAIHFGESIEMKMGLEPHLKAIAALEVIETTMHHAILHQVANPLYVPSMKILKHLEKIYPTGATGRELLVILWEDLKDTALNDALTHLLIMEKIKAGKNEKGKEVYFAITSQ